MDLTRFNLWTTLLPLQNWGRSAQTVVKIFLASCPSKVVMRLNTVEEDGSIEWHCVSCKFGSTCTVELMSLHIKQTHKVFLIGWDK